MSALEEYNHIGSVSLDPKIGINFADGTPQPLVLKRFADAAIAELQTALDEQKALDARLITNLRAEVERLKWMLEEAIADGPGYSPKNALDLRWEEHRAGC